MISFKVDGQMIKLIGITDIGEPLVSGTVKEYTCQFEFDESWTGYAKTAVFMIEDKTICNDIQLSREIILNENDMCEIPSEMLVKSLVGLRIGVYGVKDGKTKPTIFSSPLLIKLGAVHTEEGVDPPPGIYEQVLEIMEQTREIVQSIKDEAEAGKFNLTYVHQQKIPSDEWLIEHMLNKYPSVTTVDSGGTVVMGEITYIDANTLSIKFTGGFSGTAYLN